MYAIKSHDTRINCAYERIAKGWPFDERLVPYDVSFLKEIIKYFEEKEDFEKCQTVMSTLESKDHEKGYEKWKQTI